MNLICSLTDKDIGEKYFEIDNPRIRIASRGIVFREDGKIAVFNKSNKNEYKLPGGGMENNENPDETFKREVLEETGCIVEVIDNLGITEEYKCQSNFKQISHVFVGKVLKDTKHLDITQKEKDEGARLLWETPQKALELIINCYDKLVESNYESVYTTKFIVLRDRKILEYYLNNIQNYNSNGRGNTYGFSRKDIYEASLSGNALMIVNDLEVLRKLFDVYGTQFLANSKSLLLQLYNILSRERNTERTIG